MEVLKSPSEVLETGTGKDGLLLSARRDICKASRCLSEAMARMEATELLVLRACATEPTEPVASIQLLHDIDEGTKYGEWLALVRLEGAREHGQDALRCLDDCTGRLWTLALMLDGLPGAPRPAPHARRSIEEQVDAVAEKLPVAYGNTFNMISLIGFATEPALALARIPIPIPVQ
ncbi:uncharacterized protein LOC112269293 [Brachypodium distachyon]|uniref:uncharacterized protein LOC112269293 n=1 Tax=Brachypodium distachyon TaxID=15368 RepID=UPI000D0DFDF5|nr:uncharacterized protein LOC112269293 [Brachypodium distachyon]|eukprot:XP_024311525.1 uncharacterized protein LOC112269293 [Brachypodium distachyon]